MEANEFCQYYDGESDKDCSKCPISGTCDVLDEEMKKMEEKEIIW
jgi:hypothetical protein